MIEKATHAGDSGGEMQREKKGIKVFISSFCPSPDIFFFLSFPQHFLSCPSLVIFYFVPAVHPLFLSYAHELSNLKEYNSEPQSRKSMGKEQLDYVHNSDESIAYEYGSSTFKINSPDFPN